ncbi:GNAT family N-acetyltransferase [Solihabitans fulvus]|uniref:GNAT family N-acetyltransferase n=1 Tax=Solihabitans fulvus TaxID=1892852 RepID=A0A5B2XDS9_9PSEU|nr:GNAT family N-acetyltransferase [Solihabitans fulvus]KAA2261150.1 GNAT family N-acetyltransferase [Solihabitans fulvus]
MSTDPVAAGEFSTLVRAARTEDARAIATIHVASWRVTYRGAVPDDYLAGLSVDRRVPSWEQRITEPTQHVLVAEAAGQVRGFAAVGPCRDADAEESTGELYAIYLDPDWAARGLGTLLDAGGAAALAGAGFRRATLWVLDSNERARRFYERQGWAADGASKVDESPVMTLHEVRYARTLT